MAALEQPADAETKCPDPAAGDVVCHEGRAAVGRPADKIGFQAICVIDRNAAAWKRQ